MRISIHPIAGTPSQTETEASVHGDVLTVDGVEFDLGPVPDGGVGTPEGNHPFIGKISRVDGEIHCAISWSYNPRQAASWQGAEVSVLTVDAGPIHDPIVREV